MDAEPHRPTVKSEPSSPAGCGDEVEEYATSCDCRIKMETVFRELPVEFEPKTDEENNFYFNARKNDSTEIRINEENITNISEMDVSPRILNVRPERGCFDNTGYEGESGEDTYTNIDISHSDIKQECSKLTKNAKQDTGAIRRNQNAPFKATNVLATNPGPPLNRYIKCAAKDNPRGRTPKLTRVKLFLCSLCTFSCKQKEDLTKHNNSHIGEKPFSCPDCTYTCNRKVHLRDHILTHAGVKPFSCSHCTYSCNRKGQLTSHMFIHSGDKPFSCSFCPFTCKQKGALTRHNKTHSAEKPFSCPECTYTCCRKGVLRTHMDRHAGNRLISCSHCTYTCYLKQDLRTHMITHTGVKPFACGLCDFKCCRKRVLLRHRMLIHSEETQ